MGISSLSSAAHSVRSDETRLYIQLQDGRELSVPLGWFPRLMTASPQERADWRLIGAGEGIHWDALDEDISVPRRLGLPCE
jgi:hypothetical protein